MLALVGGGARSGKSTFAESLARERGSRLAYIATAEALDHEMHERIAKHRESRGDVFLTIEEPRDLLRAFAAIPANVEAVVLDCLTLWLSNLMLAGETDLAKHATDAAQAAQAHPALIIAVTNEVGSGIVPDNELARRYRDEAGRMNQIFAAHATEVYLVAFGLPLRMK